MTVEVVAAAILDRSGRVLTCCRPAGKEFAGLWEFPGGKIEAGESAEAALRRELREELGIDATLGRRLIELPYRYPTKRVRIQLFAIDTFSGEPEPREGQGLRWCRPEALLGLPLLAANRPLVQSLLLPQRLLITPSGLTETELLSGIEAALTRGVRLLQLRLPEVKQSDYLRLAKLSLVRCRAAGAKLLLHGAPELLQQVSADGLHLPSRQLLALRERPVPTTLLLGASCHSPAELAQAAAIGADYATLGPVQPTASHPAAQPLGWTRFEQWVSAAALPVYALGGIGEADLPNILHRGGQGVAAIRALWRG